MFVFKWTIEEFSKIDKYSTAVLNEPGTVVSAGIAGAVGRAVVLPLDLGGPKGPVATVARRAPQWAVLFGIYVPLANRINSHFKDPLHKLYSTVFIGAMAGWLMRALCNPISRVGDEMLRTNEGVRATIAQLRKKTVLQFWYTTHPILCGMLYSALLLTAFEGTRRFIERNFISQDSVKNAVITNAIAGGIGAGIASTVAFPYSVRRYVHTVIHDSAVCRGLLPTLIKEVPMCATVFGSFTLLQSVLTPQHGPRAGFGA
jgi:hypothetical protein